MRRARDTLEEAKERADEAAAEPEPDADRHARLHRAVDAIERLFALPLSEGPEPWNEVH